MTRILLVTASFLAGALLIYFVLAQRFPLSGDDYSYLYQAKLFASGKLYAKDPVYDSTLPFHDCVETFCLRDDQGRRFSKYPPGWPAILAVGVKLRVPWVVDPLLGALLIFLMLRYVEQRMGPELVRVASFLILFCFFLCFYAGSFRAHIAAALFVFAAFLLYESSQTGGRHSKLWLFGAGALLGYSAMIRYLDWIPLSVWIGVTLLRRKRIVDLVLFGIGFWLLASGNFIYNTMLSGDPFRPPAWLHQSPGSNNDRLMIEWNGFKVTAIRLANLLWVFPPTLLFVILILWKRYQLSSRVKMYLVLFSISVATYFFYPANIGGPGPRYFLPAFPFLILATVELYQWSCHNCARFGHQLWKVAMIGLVVCSWVFVLKEAYIMYGRRDLDRAVRKVSDGRTIFLLKTGTYATSVGDLTRNPPVLSSADKLYFKWCDGPVRDALLERFPGRSIFVYEYPGTSTPIYRLIRILNQNDLSKARFYLRSLTTNHLAVRQSDGCGQSAKQHFRFHLFAG